MNFRLTSLIFSLAISFAIMATPARAMADSYDKDSFSHLLHEALGKLKLRSFERYSWKEINPGATWDPRAGLESVELNGQFFIMGGRTPLPPPAAPFESIIQKDVWMSRDRGETWQMLTDSAWPERAFFEAVTKGRYIYVMGGQSFIPSQPFPLSTFYNDVHRSEDGIEWELLTNDAPWAGRAGLSAVVHRGRIFVFGGAKGDDVCIGGAGRTFFRDVHSSRNGVDWELVTEEAPWPGRGGGAAVSKGGWIYYVGGEEGFGLEPFADVWRSRKGDIWEKLTDEAFLPRSGHKCGVVNDHIVCFGGFNLDGNPMDVQVSRDGVHWHGLDESGTAAPPWMAKSQDDIKYDFDIIVSKSKYKGKGGIYTFGGDREVFEDCSAGPPTIITDQAEEPSTSSESDIRVDNDVWRFAPNTHLYKD